MVGEDGRRREKKWTVLALKVDAKVGMIEVHGIEV